MEHTNTHGGLPLLVISWLLNVLSLLDKETITFVLGTMVTILAIINYIVQIRKNSRK